MGGVPVKTLQIGSAGYLRLIHVNSVTLGDLASELLSHPTQPDSSREPVDPAKGASVSSKDNPPLRPGAIDVAQPCANAHRLSSHT
ncbi:hypothetical protein CNECB9_930018 [Cupriavidus necator]|uniref:Uncharacterized protein n=1 Tax=Cupriavidus necator TaxID=106590 RepID=A0A1K0JMZ7_CUPNE|nr:hypothetical protein CNECB9_930018 [Cupriavidus necator]